LPPHRRAEDPAWWEWEQRWLLAQNVEGIVACHLGLAEGPGIPLERLGEIQVPTLLVGHPDDPQHPQATVELLASRLPRAEVVWEPFEAWADHHPAERAATVLDFLHRVDPHEV